MKKIYSLLTALVIIISMAVPIAASEADEVKLTIVHTNDVHARVNGEAYVASYVESLKAAGENVFLVSAGDALHGQPVATLNKGEAIVNIMNAVGYDVLAPGNHDFDYGTDRLLELVESLNFDVVCGNFSKSGDNDPVFDAYVIKEAAGVKIGFFGLSTPETATKTSPVNVEGYSFLNPVETAEKAVAALKEEGVDVIICIAHLGVDEETAETERSTAVAEVNGIDVVIDGHSHTELEKGKTVGNTLIAQTGEYLNNVGVVEITVSKGSVTEKNARLLAIPEEPTDDWMPNKAVSDVIDSAFKENEVILSQVIGKTPVDLDGRRETNRTGETNLANLITSAMLDASGADLAILNGGGVRETINAGDITYGDVLSVLPFSNLLCTVKIKGSDFIEAVEYGLSSYPEPAGGFPQLSGISVVFDPGMEAGSRVISATMPDGSQIDMDKTYTVATNDFLAVGGDGYTMLIPKEGFMEFSSLEETLINYIQKGADLSNIQMNRIVPSEGTAEAPETVEAALPEAVPSPAVLSAAQPALKGGVHVIIYGDSLIKIAADNNVPLQTLMEANSFTNAYLIYPGQEIVVPAA